MTIERVLRQVVTFTIALSSLLAAALPSSAQRPASPAAPRSIPALFISDIHYDPLRDPAHARQLNAAPASAWAAILAQPPSPTRDQDYAAIQKTCPIRGYDTDQALWQSTLAALRAQASNVRFITLSGDLLPHNLVCRYKVLFPQATHADYLNFTLNSIRYTVATLRAALPGIPLYIALGNNDTACNGNSIDPNSDFLALVAKVIAESLPPADRASVLRTVPMGGYYSIPMAAPMRHTRLLVVDNLFFLTEFSTCAGQKNYSEEAAQTAWLNQQLALARRHHERVWVLGHIPPGVSLYTTFLHNLKICDGVPPFMSQHTEGIAQAMASSADIVRLGIFAHTHSDAFSLITPTLGDPGPTPPPGRIGVPVKIVASISPINGNNPSFTLARVDPDTATLLDYTIVQASNQTGIDTTWAPSSHFDHDYSEPDFSASSLSQLIARFYADPKAQTPASQAYIRDHYSSEMKSTDRVAGWPVSVCQMDHDSGKSFAACACASGAMPPQ